MARGDINLHIGTSYDGEGFKRLGNALNKTGGELKKTSGVVNSVTGALGGMDNQASKAVGAVGSLVSSFATMGVAGLVVGAASMAFSFLKEKADAAKESIKKVAEAVRSHLVSALGDAEKRAKEMSDSFQASGEKIKGFYSQTNSRAESYTRLDVGQKKEEHIKARQGMTDEHQIALDKAQEQYDVGKLQADSALQKARRRVEELKSLLKNKKEQAKESSVEVEDAKERESDIRSKANRYVSKRDELKGKIDEAEEKRDKQKENEDWKGYVQTEKELKSLLGQLAEHEEKFKGDAEMVKKAEEHVTKAEEAQSKVIEERKRLEEDLASAQTELKAAIQTHRTSLFSLDETLSEQKKQVQKAVDAEKEQARKQKEIERKQKEKEAEDKKRLEAERKRQQQREEELAQQKADRKKIHDIQEQTARKLSELNPVLENMKKAADKWSEKANAAKGLSLGDWRKEERRKKKEEDREVQSRVKNIMQAETQKKSIESRIFDRNGKLKRSASSHDVQTWKELNEYLQLQANPDDKTREAALREQKKIGARIFDRNGKLKRTANENDVERWKQLQKNFVNPDNPVQRLKAAEEEKNKIVKKQADDIKVIKDKMEKVGL